MAEEKIEETEPKTEEKPAADGDAPKEPKKANKPDETVLKEKIATEDEKIVALQERLQKIKEQLDARDGRNDAPNSELAIAKTKYNNMRAETRRVQQEKRNIYDQISAADDLKKQQQDLTTRLREQLQFFSVEDIERKIKALEHQQQTATLTIKEDKKIMEDIKRLSSNKPLVKQYDEAQESLRGVKEHHNNLYSQLKAKTAELNTMKEEEDSYRSEMDAARAKEDEKKSDVPALFKERDQIRRDIAERREEIRKLRDEFNEQRKEWFAYQKYVRDLKNKEYQERKAKEKAEWDEYKKKLEEEEAKRDPWEEEKYICEQLIAFCEKLVPKVEEVKVSDFDASSQAVNGMTVAKKKDLDDDDPFAALGKKKGKGKKGGGGGGGAAAAAPAKPKSAKIAMSPQDFGLWEKLGFSPPRETSECPELIAKLIEKREWLKTAPPKPKKEKKKEVKEEAKEEAKDDEAVGADGRTKAEIKAKQDAEAKKAAEKAAVEAENAARAAELEKSGKKVTGGMHKFDASEVDVHGGDATADDLMDAFGFDMGGAEDAEEEVAADAAPTGGNLSKSELVSVTALAEDKVKVEFNMAAKEGEAAKEEVGADGRTKAEIKAKQDAEAKKAAEKAAVEAENAARADALEKSGKKVTGGMHKFDASEVDVNGGTATADDFMDAFGF